MRTLSLGLGFAGLLLGTAVIGWFGFTPILLATATIGTWGFTAVCAWQMVLFLLLGLCWYVVLPHGGAWRLPVTVWGRMVRDAAGGLLPFSLVGGFVLGARAVTLLGVAWPVTVASTVVDLTTEFLAQIGLVLVGVVLLVARMPGATPVLPISIGLAVALAAGLAFMWLQRRDPAPLLRLSRRVLGGSLPGVDAQAEAVQQALAQIYATPWRVALGTALHLLAWFGTGGAGWIAFRLLGADIGFADALGIEALLHAVLAAAVLVPGYVGVQEVAYAGVGAFFGQPAELTLAVSLLRRARDVALGVPILLVWQALEWQRRRTC